MDVIIVSYAKDAHLRQMTENAIKTAQKDNVNIIVVEQDKKVTYKVKTLHYDFPFNYHKCLNLGLKECTDEYVALCNNDIIFTAGWSKALISVLELGFDTVCPYCRRTHPERRKAKGNHIYEGFQVGFEFIGWCIVGKTELFRELKLNEEIQFWYSDNFLAKQLQWLGKRHALVCNSFVEHIHAGSQTLLKTPVQEKTNLTSRQKRIYEKELKKMYAKGKGN